MLCQHLCLFYSLGFDDDNRLVMHLHILKELGLLLLYNNTPNCLDVDQILLDIVRENIKDQDGD